MFSSLNKVILSLLSVSIKCFRGLCWIQDMIMGIMDMIMGIIDMIMSIYDIGDNSDMS